MHTILFIDDEKDILNSLYRLFLEEGYKIFLADSANEGLKILEKEEIELVMVDQKMPEMDGIELLQVVKNRWPNIIRIMLTGEGYTQTARTAIYDSAVYRYILKPWNDEEIKKDVRQAFTYL